MLGFAEIILVSVLIGILMCYNSLIPEQLLGYEH